MEVWEQKTREEVLKSLGPAGGAPQLTGAGGLTELRDISKAAEQMARSYDHVLPKIDLNHNGCADADEIIKLSRNSKSLDAETKKVVDFLDQTTMDIADMRPVGVNRYNMSVSKTDMKEMVHLVDSNCSTLDAMERGIAKIKFLLHEKEAKPCASLKQKVESWLNQEAIKFAAPAAIQGELSTTRIDLCKSIEHVRQVLKSGDTTRSISMKF